jgi:hypothetical protein
MQKSIIKVKPVRISFLRYLTLYQSPSPPSYPQRGQHQALERVHSVSRVWCTDRATQRLLSVLSVSCLRVRDSTNPISTGPDIHPTYQTAQWNHKYQEYIIASQVADQLKSFEDVSFFLDHESMEYKPDSSRQNCAANVAKNREWMQVSCFFPRQRSR